MTTESKKLQAYYHANSGRLRSVGHPPLDADAEEIRETVRIAHEQREVIKKLDKALRDRVSLMGKDYTNRRLVEAALDAAAPFLED